MRVGASFHPHDPGAVIVTGAASGIGAATAQLLLGCGVPVVAVDIDKAALARLADEQSQRGTARLDTFPADVCSPGAPRAAIEIATSNYGLLGGVVSNAGAPFDGALEDLSDDEWQRCMTLNLTSHFYMTKEALRQFRNQMSGGSIVYVASKVAVSPSPGLGAYSIAKGGLLQLCRLAAMEGGALSVRANAVSPGPIFEGSSFWNERLLASRARFNGVPVSELRSLYRSRTALGHEVSCDAVAATIQFLLSDAAAYLTGAILPVDAGCAESMLR